MASQIATPPLAAVIAIVVPSHLMDDAEKYIKSIAVDLVAIRNEIAALRIRMDAVVKRIELRELLNAAPLPAAKKAPQ